MTKSEIQLVKSLSDKRSRTETGLFIAEGEKLISELRDSALNVRKIYSLEGVFEGEGVEWVAPREMERISQLKSANNSVALVDIPRYEMDIDELCGQLFLILDSVQNPGNLGTIIRLADWFGIENIICSPNSADCFNPKVVQATMGAILRVKVHYTPLEELLTELQQRKVPIYGTLLEGENIYSQSLWPNGAIIMGNEGQGISPEVQQFISHKLFIPPFPADRDGSESLNVSIATAVVCSEFRRRYSDGEPARANP
ncbi:MAG: RNA methyltransferase [Rikenellaceae bacterium]